MLIFKNDGLIELDAIRIQGISVKETTNAFGQFGTGIKYGLSVFLREGCDVTLIRGGELFEFTKRQIEVRGKNFDAIYMNDEQLAFTTQMGKLWEPWQAYREFYCNCRDEGGEIEYVENGTKMHFPDSATQTIFIVKGAAADRVWAEQDSIILRSKPSEVIGKVEVHLGETEYVYYRGVRAMKLQTKADYTYNILEYLDLTEDRNIRYSFQAEALISRAVPQSTWEDYLARVLTADKSWEAKIDYDNALHSTPSKQFMDVCTELRQRKTLNAAASKLFNKYIERSPSFDRIRKAVNVTEMHHGIIREAKLRLHLKGIDLENHYIHIDAPRDEMVPRPTFTNNSIYVDIRNIERGVDHLAMQLLMVYAHTITSKNGTRDMQLAHHILYGCFARIDNPLVNDFLDPTLEPEAMPF
jgi:hypothetical protein